MLVGATYVWHLFSDMGDAVEATETIERVDEARDEADAVAAPPRVVDPSSEDKAAALIRWGTRDHCDKDDKPTDLEIEQGELVERRNDLVPEKHYGCCEEVQDLVDHKCLPRFDHQVGVVKRI